MSNGMIFNGRHSSDFKLAMRSDNRQLLPATRDEYQYAIDRDGSVLFDDALDDRFIEVSFTTLTDTGNELQQKARQIASWLRTKERTRITFDDEPDKFYMGKVSTQVDIERVANMGEFTVTFRCEPYAYKITDQQTFDITDSPTTLNIENTGTVKTPATFIVNNAGSNTLSEFTLEMEEEL